MRRRALALASAALLGAACAALAAAFAAPAAAASPMKDGWWSEANLGLGFFVPPPQVPSGGLYVENGFSGPVAMAAVTYEVPPGSAVGPLELQVAGQAVITSPPVACPLTAAGRGYSPAQGGAWSQRPAYDCTRVQVTATVASNHSTVSFDTGPLLQDGAVAVAILAGGPADEIAFDPPGPQSLPITPPGTAPPAGLPAPSGVPTFPPVPSLLFPEAVGAAPGPLPALPAAGAGVIAPPAATAPASPAPSPRGQRAVASARSLAASSGLSGPGVAEILASVGLVGLLVAYSGGYGLLGGRIGVPAGPQRPAARRSPPA